MRLMSENFVQHGYPKVTEWLKVEDKCAKVNKPIENNNQATPDKLSGATNVISFGSIKLLSLIIFAMYVY